MLTREEILAALTQRGVDVSTLGAATPAGANPAGPTPAPQQLPAGMLDALKHEGTRDSSMGEVAQEFGSGWGRSVLNNSADVANVVTTPARSIANKGLELLGAESRVPEIPQLGDDMFPGGQMAAGEEQGMIAEAGELGPEILSFAGGAGGLGSTVRGLSRTLGRGSSRVAAKARKAPSSARGGSSKPRVQVRNGQQVGGPTPNRGGFKNFMKDQASGATAGAAVGGATTGDPLKGAMYGMAMNNPLGRWAMSRMAGNMFGDKARALTYVGSHPATKRAARRLAKALARTKEK